LKKIKKRFEENQQIINRKSDLNQSSLNYSPAGVSTEGLGTIRTQMLKKFKDFLEGYEPIIVDFIKEQEQNKYEDIIEQNKLLKKERDEMLLKVEKFTHDLHTSKRESLMYKSKYELAESQKQVLEKKRNEQLTSENSGLSKLCEEILAKLENV